MTQRLRGMSALVVLFLLAMPVAAAQENGPEHGIGLAETVKQIMEREALLPPPASYQIGIKGKRLYPDRSGLPQDPASPDAAAWPPLPGRELLPPTESPQTPGISFTGATLSGSNPTFAFPPDVMGDVGPSQYIVAVNGRIVTFSKTTGSADGVLNASMNGFFTSVRNGSGTSDPRIRFDRLSQRWFVLIINVATVSNRILIAVSNTATISAGTVWTFFYLQHDLIAPAGDTGLFIDYPTLGIDANALYIGGNIFDLAGGGFFVNTSAYVVRKSSLTSGGPAVATAFRNLISGGLGPYTPQGVDNFDAGATEGYFIAVDASLNGRLVLRRVTDPAGSPSISGNITITVTSTANPNNVRHLGNTGGTNGYLSCVDDRLFHAFIRNGRLWTAHTILVNNTGTTAGGTRNGARWYELQNLAGSPTVVQSGTVFAATAGNDVDQRNYWFPSIMVSGQGHAAMGFSTAGTNEYANAATVGRLKSDPLGTMGTPVLTTASSAAYNPPGDPGSASQGRRWGDYSYTSIDPDDDMTMWTAQEYTNSTNSYGVRVVQLLAPPPASPVAATPSSVAAGLASVVVTVTGTAISGSAFFDPGAGFAKHISASINASVTVNSVTLVNDTTVTLNLNTTLANPGPRNVTITNPDGQSRTGTSILTITAGAASLTLTGPNGGDTVLSGATVPVSWNSANLSGNVRITLSRDGGVTFPETLFANTPNDGTQQWTVTGPTTTTARVRITSIATPSLSDTSDGDFTIGVRILNLTAPSAGQVLPVDSTVTLTWTSAFVPGAVTIELSRDGGSVYAPLFSSTDNDGAESWLVTGPSTAAGVLRLTSDEDSTLEDLTPVYIGASFNAPFGEGWNTIALPVDVADPSRQSLFPGAVSSAFLWTSLGYQARDTLVPGAGYWLKFPSAQVGVVAGLPRTGDTVGVAAGWNLIGSIGVPVPVDSIVQIPGGIVTSPYFVYGPPSYSAADTLFPLKAYWVKASAPGQLVLPSPVPGPARRTTSPLPPFRTGR